MEKAIEYLENSLLYQMSLGSKELYHSNIWAGLMEKEKNIISAFFKDFSLIDYNYEEVKIERETHNRDIIIKLKSVEKKEYFVIENKIKTLPNIEQLERYTEDIDGYKLAKAVFTGIENPFGGDVCVESNNTSIIWHFCSYKEISERIMDLANKSKNLLDKLSQIKEYCEIIKNIEIALNNTAVKNMGKLIYESNDNLSKVRLKDLNVKLKGANFLSYIHKRKNEISVPQGFQLIVNQSFNNGKVTIDIRFSNKTETASEWLILGVQIEEYQYRLMAERNKNEYNCVSVYKEFENNWFNRREISKSMRNPFCKYEGKDYSFVYQYEKITEKDNGYERIFNKIKEDLKVAKNILESLTQQ